MKFETDRYQSPDIEIVEVEVEQGFAYSLEDTDENEEMDW